MEKLYNNIILEDDFRNKPNDFQNVPYLNDPPEIIDVSVGRQLFTDDFLIEETNLKIKYHKAVKYEGNPVLKAERQWEIAQSPVACPKSGGVFYDMDEQKFKMWYEAGWLRHMAYVESKDGIYWERPNLSEVEGTNIILPYKNYAAEKYSDDITYLRPDSTTVFIDYDAQRSERYKLFLRNPGGSSEGFVATSADGIHFENFRKTPKIFDRSTVFYNPFRKKWVYSIRDLWSGRSRTYRECDDFLNGANWQPEDALPWMCCDEKDVPDPYINFKPQLYNVDAVGYESIMLASFQKMYGPENNICEDTGMPKITELEFMFSRDGYHFSRPFRESVIGASKVDGYWDRGYIQSVGGLTIIHGDELWIYYTGFSGDKAYSKRHWTENGMYRGGATGIAKLRRDGFASVSGNGTLYTRPIVFKNKETLHINCNGRVFAEIYSLNGELLARSKAFDGNSTNQTMDFDEFSVSSLQNIPIRIKFYVDGELYSFGFADKKGNFGGAYAGGIIE